jgi:hypothetical protein
MNQFCFSCAADDLALFVSNGWHFLPPQVTVWVAICKLTGAKLPQLGNGHEQREASRQLICSNYCKLALKSLKSFTGFLQSWKSFHMSRQEICWLSMELIFPKDMQLARRICGGSTIYQHFAVKNDH